MTKLLQEQIDQLRHDVSFLARQLTSQDAAVQALLARRAVTVRQARTDGDVGQDTVPLCENVASDVGGASAADVAGARSDTDF